MGSAANTRETRRTLEAFEHVEQAVAFLHDLVLAHLLPHAEVSQLGQSEAPHLLPGLPVGPDHP